MFEYTAILRRVVDGDTLELDIDVGFRMHYFCKCRLARVNAPEMLEFGGVQARLFVEAELAKATGIVVTSKRLDKYGRVLGEVRFTRGIEPDEWINLSDLLLSTGHGLPYRW
jgi:micrococcal nuclease